MLEAYGIGAGDEVIVPAHTFIASALAVEPCRRDARAVRRPRRHRADRPGRGARGRRPPHCGDPRRSPLRTGVRHRRDRGVRQAARPARPRGRGAGARGDVSGSAQVGSLGDAAAFSFYPSKNLGALGDGGAICTDDDVLAARLRRLRNLGQRTKGEHVELGYNERLDGLQAALLRVKLVYLDMWNEARRMHAGALPRAARADRQLVEERRGSPSVHHLFPARFDDRDAVAQTLGRYGIETGVHYSPAVHASPSVETRSAPPRRGSRTRRPGPRRSCRSQCIQTSRRDEIERVAEAVHAAVHVPNALSGENRC